MTFMNDQRFADRQKLGNPTLQLYRCEVGSELLNPKP